MRIQFYLFVRAYMYIYNIKSECLLQEAQKHFSNESQRNIYTLEYFSYR